MGSSWSQSFPPAPTLTETNLPSQEGKVLIVTGGASGVGFELSSLLYSAGAKVYIAGRSEANFKEAESKIKTSHPNASGELLFLQVALDDLSTIKPAAEKFKSAETRLDVLFNNAGVSAPPSGSKGAQGHELQLSTNCLGPYLLTQLLLPVLISTAKTTKPGATRVIWTSSLMTDVLSPKGGYVLDHLKNVPKDNGLNYATSKTANWFLADGLAKQVGSDDILSVTINPGNLKTNILRYFPGWVPAVINLFLYEPRYGAYTNLWAGFSPDLTLEDGGKYVLPWGRLHPSPRKDIVNAMKTKEEGGTGVAASFLQFCSDETSKFA